MNQQKILLPLLFLFYLMGMRAADYNVVSPDGQLKIVLHVSNGTQYELWRGEKQLVASSSIGLNLNNGTVIGSGTVAETQTRNVNNELSVFIGKNKTLTEAYNELLIRFNENYDLLVRAYNEGLAYRFITRLGGEIIIDNEDMVFNFPEDPKVYFPECSDYQNFERAYAIYPSVSGMAAGKWAVSPTLFAYPNAAIKLTVTEADTYDYPGLYITTNGEKSMKGMWARYPLAVQDPNNYYSNHLPTARAEYIAKTNGSRTFPWRVFIVSDNDKALLNNNLVYLLAEPCRLTGDLSWIQPGKTAWEWWHKAVLEGVDFPSGNRNLSFELYRYYVDWASATGLEYITIDAGWEQQDLYLAMLCAYAKTKNVKIVVWTWASCVLEDPSDWIVKMKNKGVAGAKIDFFERNDQLAMRWGHQMAQKLADNKMVAIFHGCPVPTGLNRTFPNLLNFEAVRGEEDNFWRDDTGPDYHTLFPFIRSLVGPEDYTPGSMRNVTKEEFRPIDVDNTPPMSMGTRAHELSMYVIYDQWLAYLSDSPTEYNKFPDIKDFLSKVPSTWDKTVPLNSELGEYILMAKQKSADWYVGGMTNWTARDMEVDFSFLPAGMEYQATVLRDADNSDTQPKQYVSETITVTSDTKRIIHAAKGGGFAIRLYDPKPVGIAKVNSSEISVYVDRAMLYVKSGEAVKSVRIYNIAGQSVWSRDVARHVSTLEIPVSTLSHGAYIVNVQVDVQKDKTTKTFKFIY
ncbi:MAG: glycoside hydrolase family 97 catalytic domain-containing protein [Bacteroidales bacterium]|jgi:alpha-glucosidase|nr:glycoside hydrolase family 97 catalytic domain-containing protein [Bacteroidales bacterium]